jgi:uncharacterized protein (DUF302 family)
MAETGAYYFGKTVDLPYQETVTKVREALAAQGFGILSEIDVRDKLREKLEVDFRPYIILGACNPKLAHQALQAEINLGTLLPCNVVVYSDEVGKTRVVAMDPVRAMAMIDNPQLEAIAGQVRELLEKALEAV